MRRAKAAPWGGSGLRSIPDGCAAAAVPLEVGSSSETAVTAADVTGDRPPAKRVRRKSARPLAPRGAVAKTLGGSGATKAAGVKARAVEKAAVKEAAAADKRADKEAKQATKQVATAKRKAAHLVANASSKKQWVDAAEEQREVRAKEKERNGASKKAEKERLKIQRQAEAEERKKSHVEERKRLKASEQLNAIRSRRLPKSALDWTGSIASVLVKLRELCGAVLELKPQYASDYAPLLVEPPAQSVLAFADACRAALLVAYGNGVEDFTASQATVASIAVRMQVNPTTHHLPPTTHHSPLTTHHSPLTTHYSPLTTHYSLLPTPHSLLTSHRPPFTMHHSLITATLESSATLDKPSDWMQANGSRIRRELADELKCNATPLTLGLLLAVAGCL